MFTARQCTACLYILSFQTRKRLYRPCNLSLPSTHSFLHSFITARRLNYHLFASLRKAVYKPAAFYRGILLPLAAGSCSLKEATVVAACLSKVSVPANHSAVCLLKLCELPYSGPTSLFIRVLLNKK